MRIEGINTVQVIYCIRNEKKAAHAYKGCCMKESIKQVTLTSTLQFLLDSYDQFLISNVMLMYIYSPCQHEQREQEEIPTQKKSQFPATKFSAPSNIHIRLVTSSVLPRIFFFFFHFFDVKNFTKPDIYLE